MGMSGFCNRYGRFLTVYVWAAAAQQLLQDGV